MRAKAAVFGSAFAIGLSGAIVPGPMFAATVASTTARGFWAGPEIVLGHGALECLLILLIAWGLGRALQKDKAVGAIALAGGACLLWMGFGVVAHASAIATGEHQSPVASFHPVAVGVITSIANPYWVLWWATIGVTYVGLSLQQGRLGLAFFASGHVLSDLAWFSLVSGLVAAGRDVLGGAVFRNLLIGCGILLLGFGGYFVVVGFRKLARAFSR